LFNMLFVIVTIATTKGVPWATLLPILSVPASALITALGAWLVAVYRRRASTDVYRTPAQKVWDERGEISDAYKEDRDECRRELAACRKRIEQVESRMAALEAENVDLRKKIVSKGEIL